MGFTDYLLVILVIAGIVFLFYHWIQYLKSVRRSEGYAKRRAVSLLFVGLISVIGISSIFADALFELLGLDRPLYFELISIAAYAIFAIATVLIMKTQKENTSQPLEPTIAQENSGGGDNQDHSGTGDIVSGRKIEQKAETRGTTIYVEGDYKESSKKKRTA